MKKVLIGVGIYAAVNVATCAGMYAAIKVRDTPEYERDVFDRYIARTGKTLGLEI